MTNYTRELLLRMSLLVAWLMVFLIAVTTWYQQTNTANENHSIFKPAQKIHQLKSMQAALDEQGDPSIVNKHDLNCDRRGEAILTIRTMNGLSLDINEARETLQQINRKINFKMRCDEWVENIQNLAKHQAKQKNGAADQAYSIDASLSEQVSWRRQTPCLFVRTAQSFSLMMGNVVRCQQTRFPNDKSTQATTVGFKAMQQATKSFLSNAPNDVVQSMRSSDYLFTIDPLLQSIFDRWAECFRTKTCTGVPQAHNARHVSAVVVDVNTGDVLAALCWSGGCDKSHMKNLSHLGALLIEAPPASTAKLLHAMVLAQNSKTDSLMLQRQIKTSGQTDQFVSKRNEWWEKQAICEELPHKPCNHALLVQTMAEEFQWNQNCSKASIYCGRTSMIEHNNSLIISGLIGHTRISSTPLKSTPLMKWADYDAIRQGKKKTDGSIEYLNTALSIQSVIGAGDSRTSALGLAHLSAQIYRLSQGQSIQAPTLIRALNQTTEFKNIPKNQQLAAQVVLGGMRKVVQPAEVGWKDPGTVANTLEKVMGKTCTEDCGIWAKTGTVSQQDPNYAGTSLFTGVFDLQKVHRWKNIETDSTRTNPIAIGVISIPVKGVRSTHLASELAVHLMNELTIAQRPIE